MERKLASIQRIKDLKPILNADRIELAIVGGWQTVVKKGEFSIGDLCVFFEIDSILPDKPEFEFMRPRKSMVKSMKMKGVLSQGLALPLIYVGLNKDFTENTDVTNILEVKKYELPISFKNGDSAGLFPSYLIPKTDEIRVQSAMGIIDELKNREVYITVKCDGTSATYLLYNNEFIVCSRGFIKKDGDNIYWNIARKYDIENRLRSVYRINNINLGIQGEICGEGIAKNRMGLEGHKFFVFNVYNLNTKTYYDIQFANGIAWNLDLDFVPYDSFYSKLAFEFPFDTTLDKLLDMAKGNYEGTNNPREGIVIRPTIEAYSETLKGRMSIKVINNEYLLKE